MGILDGKNGRMVGDSVLGAIMAGAAGANPLLGLLAGPLLKNAPSRKRKELENEQLRDQISARKELPGVLTSASMPHPMSARPGSHDVPLPPSMHAQHAVEGQANLAGVLGRIQDPVLTQSILRAPTKPPADIATLDALGMPRTMESIAALSQATNVPRQLTLEEMRLNATQQQVADENLVKLRFENNETRREFNTRLDAQHDAMTQTGETVVRLNEYLKKTKESSLVQPGSTFANERKAIANLIADGSRFLGADDFADKMAKEVTAYEGVDKESAVLVGDLLGSAQAAGITVTRSLQQLFERSSPGSEIQATTSESILQVIAQELLAKSKRSDRPISDELRRALEGLSLLSSFETEADVEAAIKAGDLEPGTVVTINGRRAIAR